MKKILCLITVFAMLFSINLPGVSAAEVKTVIASEDITLQSDNKAYTEKNLLVKNQNGATRRLILLKFDYGSVDTDRYGKAMLNLYAIYRNSGTGKDNPNTLSVYWSPTVDDWDESTTAWNAQPTDITEVGDDIISLPTVGSSTDVNLNKYYSYDISSAIAGNTNADKKITIIIKQDVNAGASGGYAFACRESGDDVAPKIVFKQGQVLPQSHIKNGVVIAAKADTELDSGSPDVNYGAEEAINISANSSALLGFDLSDYTKAQIAGAGLRVYIKNTDEYNNTTLEVIGVSGAWSEQEVTAANAPAADGTYTSYIVEARKGSGYWADIDISELVRSASDLSDFSVLVQQLGAESEGIGFLSRETSDGSIYSPHIVVRPVSGGSADKTASIEAAADTYVRYDNTSSTDYSGVNFGSDNEMWVKMNASADRKAFIKFDLSAANVTTEDVCAQLSLYYKEKSGTGADDSTTVEVYYCPDSNWEESTLTAATALSMVGAAYKPEHLVGTLTLGKSTADKGYHSIDLGDFIEKHIDDSYTRNLTFMLVLKNAAGANGGAAIATKENGTPAKISIYPNIPEGYIAKPISADAHVRFGSFAAKTFGSEETLDVKNHHDESSVRELYIKADVSDKPEAAGDGVYLLMPVKHQNLGTVNLKIYGAMLDWDYKEWAEGALTANNVSDNIMNPDEMTFIGDYQVKKTQIGSYAAFDVTDYVNEAIDDYGTKEVTFRFVENDDETDQNNLIQFYSRESMYKPMLAYTTDKTPVELVNFAKTAEGNGFVISAGLQTAPMQAYEGYTANPARKVTVVGAAYDEDGRLVNAAYDKLTVDENRYKYEKSFDDAAEVKLFVWDQDDLMTPVETSQVTDNSDAALDANYYDDADIGGYSAELSPELTGDTTDYVGQREKIVVAALMLNQRTVFYSGAWRHWNNSGVNSGSYSYSHTPALVDSETGLRDIAASDYPSIGLFDISDPDYIDYQLQLLKMAGVDAVSVNIHGTGADEQWKTEVIKSVYAPRLKKYGIKAFARIDSSTLSGYTEENLDELITMFGDSVLKIDARPVISVFVNPEDRDFITKDWKNAYTEKYGTEPFVMSWGESVTSKLADYDGVYNWTGTSSSFDGYTKTDDYEKYYDVEAAKRGYVYSAQNIKNVLTDAKDSGASLDYIADGVAPGFDNRPVMGWGGTNSITKVERGENGELYKYRWANAVQNNFPMVMLPTWDDWSEGTQLMPSLKYGNLNLLITRHYAAEYKNAAENTDADFKIADWIYKIRKTTDDTSVLVDMEFASDYLAEGNYAAAAAIVRPYAFDMKLPTVTQRFAY